MTVRIITLMIGIWLMLVPDILDFSKTARRSELHYGTGGGNDFNYCLVGMHKKYKVAESIAWNMAVVFCWSNCARR